ncbi:MAG: DUF4123 domain-containing protein [Ketobacteraceae bacterium]|nr:DUF4123 domain-containing protein [Ketobacteraceae bacterium]
MSAPENLYSLISADIGMLRSQHADINGFLLLDGATTGQLIQQYFVLDESPEYRPLFLGIDDNLLCQSPFLILITSHTEPFLRWISQNYPGTAFAFLSAFSLDEQLPFWQSLLRVITPDNQLLEFRFYDGKVAFDLFRYGQENEKRLVFQPCHTLYFQQDDAYWQREQMPAREASANSWLLHSPPEPWLSLGSDTVQALNQENRHYKQSLLSFLWQHYPQQMGSMSHDEVITLIDQALSKCRELEVVSWRGIHLFTCLMLEYQEQFYGHPDVARVFHQELAREPVASSGYARGDQALQRLRAELPREFWQSSGA